MGGGTLYKRRKVRVAVGRAVGPASAMKRGGDQMIVDVLVESALMIRVVSILLEVDRNIKGRVLAMRLSENRIISQCCQRAVCKVHHPMKHRGTNALA